MPLEHRIFSESAGCSDAQVATLLKLHKQGKSLRAIVANTLLSLRAAGISSEAKRSQPTSSSEHTGRRRSEPVILGPSGREVIETGSALTATLAAIK